MSRLGHCVGGQWLQYVHAPVFRRLRTKSGADKLIATSPGSDVHLFGELAELFCEPYWLLYVLHTPRGEGEAGRYQSAQLDRPAVSNFLKTFERLLRTDGRYDLWLHSPSDQATIAWDRHDLIHIYGLADEAEAKLRKLRFEPGATTIDFAHEHYFRRENDELAGQLLSHLDWTWSPLRPEDEQGA
jgi:hypothetical protein